MSIREKLKHRILTEMVWSDDEILAHEIFNELPSEMKNEDNLRVIRAKIELSKAPRKEKKR